MFYVKLLKRQEITSVESCRFFDLISRNYTIAQRAAAVLPQTQRMEG